MSRAFVNEDASSDPGPRFNLPDPDSPYYAEAAAWALIQGADLGDSPSAERATGYRWGDPALVRQVQKIRREAQERGEERVAQLANRFLAAAGTR
jgi:hypothetical protein